MFPTTTPNKLLLDHKYYSIAKAKQINKIEKKKVKLDDHRLFRRSKLGKKLINCMLMNYAYEINHMWTVDMKSNEEWSSQLWSQFLQLRKEAWKAFSGFSGFFTYGNCKNCDHNCEDHSSFDFISAVHIWFLSYASFIYISFTGTYEPKIDLLPTSVAIDLFLYCKWCIWN